MPNLTEDEYLGFLLLHPTEYFDQDQANRLVYLENRVRLFTSEPFTDDTPYAEKVAIVGRFMSAGALHEIAEKHGQWSPAHLGYTARQYRQTGVKYLIDKADAIEDWATDHLRLPGQWECFQSSMK